MKKLALLLMASLHLSGTHVAKKLLAPVSLPPLGPRATINVDALSAAKDAPLLRQVDELWQRKNFAPALALLGEPESLAGELLRLRLHVAMKNIAAAQESLRRLHARDAEIVNTPLATLLALEEGLLGAAAGNFTAALAALEPLLLSRSSLAQRATYVLAETWQKTNPRALLDHFALLVEARPPDDLDGKSRLLGFKQEAELQLGKKEEAAATALTRYLEEPVSLLTPAQPPPEVVLSNEQILARAQVLLDAHRNERVVEALSVFSDSGLSEEQKCDKYLNLGLALRKLRSYQRAEDALSEAQRFCSDMEKARRAAFVRAKVISIRDGLRAIGPIEEFAKQHSGHTMVDDVLLWAGDLYQRRARDAEAATYYQRIEAEPEPGDQCAEARFRLAWMAFRKGDYGAAQKRFSRMLAGDGCVKDRFDRARAEYWLARVAQSQGEARAAELFSAVVRDHTLDYYGQLALLRLRFLDAGQAAALAREFTAPASESRVLCATEFLERAEFGSGLFFLQQGLLSDAAREFLRLVPRSQEVIAASHASSLGVETKAVHADSKSGKGECGERESKLLLNLLLDRAHAYKDAHWRLRTDFADELDHFPSASAMPLWRAAYPLAYRGLIEAGETEQHLPLLFEQALAREESAFDPLVVSWAGAYGLTQLLLSSGRGAGALLAPKVYVSQAEDLLDPQKNARLGAALLGSLFKRFKGHPALVLVAYNAGEDVAVALWKRHVDNDFDIFAEEITIQETRGYVKRVLRTFAIYQWLYSGRPAELPVSMRLPTL